MQDIEERLKLIEEIQREKETTVPDPHIEIKDSGFHDGSGIGINSGYFEEDDFHDGAGIGVNSGYF